MKPFFLGLILALNQVCLYSQPSYNTDAYKALPFSNAVVKLDSSWIKHRENLNTAYLRSLDPDRLLHNFRINAGLPSNAKPLEGWEAPYIGMPCFTNGWSIWLMNCINVSRHSDADI